MMVSILCSCNCFAYSSLPSHFNVMMSVIAEMPNTTTNFNFFSTFVDSLFYDPFQFKKYILLETKI